MRYGCEYETPGGMIGLCIFSAENMKQARKYVEAMKTKHGHSNVFNLNELPDGCGIDNLRKLFPGSTRTKETSK